jgi:integrase
LIDRNPLAKFQKPKAGTRETVIDPEEFQQILALVRGNALRDLLVFAWETGARAAKCLALKKRHVDVQNSRVVFSQSEDKMECAPRIIYLNDTALEIVRRRYATAAEKLFYNPKGRPWTTEAVNCAFSQIQIRMGKARMRERGLTIPEEEVLELTARLIRRYAELCRPTKSKQQFREMAQARLWNKHAARHAPKYCLTVIRHSWCHLALKQGLDALTVSQLLGHADVSMVAKVYSHLSHAPDFRREAMCRVTGTM